MDPAGLSILRNTLLLIRSGNATCTITKNQLNSPDWKMKINQRKKCTEQHNKNQSFSLYTNNSASYIYRPFFTFSLSNKQKEKRKQNNIGERVRKKKSLKRKQISTLETNLWPESYKNPPTLESPTFPHGHSP